MLDTQQLVVISSRAHLAAWLQSLEASLWGNEAEGPVEGKAGIKEEIEKSKPGFSLILEKPLCCPWQSGS